MAATQQKAMETDRYYVVPKFGEYHIREAGRTIAIADKKDDAIMIAYALNLLKDK